MEKNSQVELVLGLLMAVAVLAWIASRLRISYPILLVVGGLGLSAVPGLPTPELKSLSKPELVFLLFLPPLLYHGGILTSWRDFSANWRTISLLAVGLVVVTTVVVALVARAAIPEMSLASAFVLGAIVSPPDAVAATAITQRLNVPKRVIVILEGESLVNDAMALVLYKFAVAAAVTGAFSFGAMTLQMPIVAVGGIAIGVVVGWVASWVSQHIEHGGILAVVSLLTPFAAYLPAEWLHVSGVLAAVAAGIVKGWRMPQVLTPRARIQLNAVWETLSFLLNGLVFILLGLQLRTVLENLRQESSLAQLVWYATLISITAILIRVAFVFPTAYLPALLFESVRKREPRQPMRNIAIIAWTGMRGVVSLAAALALPIVTAQNAPFPQRDLIIFITFSVILATLVLQGLSLPFLIEWLRLGVDRSEEIEEATARYEAAHAAVARLELLAEESGIATDILDRVRWSYEDRIMAFARHMMESGTDAAKGLPLSNDEQRLRRAGVRAERAHIIQMRRERMISDDVMRRILEELDLEDAKYET